ncbi:helix-turn-helix domain-containing protein [Culicoidibacter larvae]|uniref:Helix-turn-helix transcriptional regulator n=1 Tax=Culicoidibacter larvae TaxID=2579976 RepID=A0A5R8Q7S2_9FIRM|nr:helix-turn-helix transcriptional regulator [Culicoidibacter larvae]TLG71408.1 helix-turn-helix transcriptional regulator [Culicoidibacter larvae]
MSDTNIQDIISKNLIRLMEIYGINQAQLAEIAGVSESAVGKWILKRNAPRMGAIQKIADHFNMPTSYLLHETSPLVEFDNLEKEAEKVIQFPETFTVGIADTARKYLRHMGVVAFSGRDYTTRSDEEVVKMANFIRQQELNMQQSFNTLFGDDDQ